MIALIDLISNLPMLEDSKKRKNIKLGRCIRNININLLINLLNISFKRVNIEFTEGHEQLMTIMKRDDKFMMDLWDKDDDNIIIQMVE